MKLGVEGELAAQEEMLTMAANDLKVKVEGGLEIDAITDSTASTCHPPIYQLLPDSSSSIGSISPDHGRLTANPSCLITITKLSPKFSSHRTH